MRIIIFSLLINLFLQSKGESINDALDNLKGTFSGAGTGLVEGMGQSVGVVEGYNYNYRVFNDSPAPIAAATQRITPVLGAKFSGEIKKSAIIDPFKDSGTTFYNQNLYLDVWLLYAGSSNKNEYAHYGKEIIAKGAEYGTVIPGLGSAIGALTASIFVEKKLEDNEILHKKISLGQKDDKNIYFYRAYTDKGDLKGEYLGICGVTTEFVGTFYNSTTNKDIALQFSKNSQNYRVSLEPAIFNTLSSSGKNPNAIRPSQNESRSFVFLQNNTPLATIPLNPEGIATMQLDPKSDPKSPKLIVGAPYNYTYEVYQGAGGPSVGMQGLSVGNHMQTIDPTNSNNPVIRDITPVECHIWLQSAQQYNQKMAQQPEAMQAVEVSEQIWIAYATKDMSIYQKLLLGTVNDCTLIRPLLSEKTAIFYIVSLQTNDDEKAKQFLNRLTKGILQDKPLTVAAGFDSSTLLVTPMPNQLGIIDDTVGSQNSGVKGWVLLADIFLPRGVGFGPFYYTVPPALLDSDALINPLLPFLKLTDNSGQSRTQQKNSIVDSWITAFRQSSDMAKQAIAQTITRYGYDIIKQNESLKNELIQIIVQGPVGLTNLPVRRQAGVNNYIYSFDQKPEDWPA